MLGLGLGLNKNKGGLSAGEVITDFTLTIDTTLGDGDLTFQIRVKDFIGDVNWGDGVIENNTTGGTLNLTHTYASSGVYSVSFIGTIEDMTASNFTDDLKIIGLNFGNNYGANSTNQNGFFRNTVNCLEVGGVGDFSQVTDFSLSFIDSGIATFPPNVFDNCPATEYSFAWVRNNLNQQSVDNILVSINQARLNGIQVVGDIKRIHIFLGTNATPSAIGQLATDALRADGFEVILNGY